MQAPGVRVEVWFQDEARIGQKNSLTRVWGQTGSRPVAPKDLGFASAYLFGAVCPSAGSGGADHADLQYRRDEPSPLRDQQPSRRRCPCRGDPRWCQLAQQPLFPEFEFRCINATDEIRIVE
jgi:hypothetical protein